MNTPMPVNAGQVNVPASTPTIGGMLGGVLSAAILPHVDDPIGQYAISMAISGFGAWLAHFLHSKLGTPE